jgi:hypothetical protein
MVEIVDYVEAVADVKPNPYADVVKALRDHAITEGVILADGKPGKGVASKCARDVIPGPLTEKRKNRAGDEVDADSASVLEFNRNIAAAAKAHGVTVRRTITTNEDGTLTAVFRVAPRIVKPSTTDAAK